MNRLNETHDPALTSWVPSAREAGTDFPIQNLPFAVFRRRGSAESFRGGVAIGDQIVDMAAAVQAGVFDGAAAAPAQAAAAERLNALMAMGPDAWSVLRLALSRALRTGSLSEKTLAGCLVAQADAEYAVQANIGDYTDFYIGIHHATAIGRQFRPDNPLLPNYKWVPIGYHGRCSSIVISGTPIVRPNGQLKGDGDTPDFGPCRRLDHEFELGFFVGPGNEQGRPVPMAQAERHLFGVALFNDWSARDIQAWEYQPLGPFLSKSFGSTLAPWIVTMEALAPYRVPFTRPEGDPSPLPYLDSADNRDHGALDIRLESRLQTASMRSAGQQPVRLTEGSMKDAAYWTPAQLVAHHTVNGCNLRPGDLLGSGTLSGPRKGTNGSLLELSSGGREPLVLPDGEQRTYLQDGDTLILRAWCERPGAARIGFGECSGTIEPAPALAR